MEDNPSRYRLIEALALHDLQTQTKERQKDMKAMVRKNHKVIMQLESEQNNMVIEDNTPAKKVIT